MDRIIEVKVSGNYLVKDNDLAGVQHESNATRLRIEFDQGWDGFAKKVTFWNALGENPVARTLTADLLEDITKSTRIYLCPIPGEAMAEVGKLEFVIDGWVDGVRQRSLPDKLKVKPSGYVEDPDEPSSPTPSQAEQLQQQIDTLLGNIQDAQVSAGEAAERAEEAASNGPKIGENKTWLVWDGTKGQYVDTGVYCGGVVGPTGETGPQGPAGPAGADGIPGADGKDGVSPTVSVSEITGGHRVNIQDAIGPNVFDVMDGKDGTGTGSGLPFSVEILETICENVELTEDNNTYTLPAEITLDSEGLYCIDYKTYIYDGEIVASHSGCFFSRVITDDSGSYVRFLNSDPEYSVTLTSTQITDDWMYISSILSIYKVSLNVYDEILYAARKINGWEAVANGLNSSADGYFTSASGLNSRAEGESTSASGNNSHAEGESTSASGNNSHAEGESTSASGNNSHAEGESTSASGNNSHAEGYRTIASGYFQHVQGMCNIEDTEGKYAHIVGNGANYCDRSNAHTLDWEGNAWFAGTVEGAGTVLRSTTEGSEKKFTATVDDTGEVSLVDDAGNRVPLNGSKLTVSNTAAVGQTIRVSAVDENGQPTQWEAVDMYSKEEIDTALGSYINDVAALVGGDA